MASETITTEEVKEVEEVEEVEEVNGLEELEELDGVVSMEACLSIAKERVKGAVRRFDGCMAAYLAARRDVNEARTEVDVAWDDYIRLLEGLTKPE